MATCRHLPIGICSWSLTTDLLDVIKTVNSMGLDHVHLDLSPAFEKGAAATDYLKIAGSTDWTISATMIRFPQEDYTSLETIKATGGIMPDEHWPSNRERALRALDMTAELGAPYLTTHAGFLDHENETLSETFYDRISELADAALDRDLFILMETGQESAADLHQCLEDLNHPALGVNFDPANMILYNKGNPIEAVEILAPWIKHVHIKDAIQTETPGTWGTEVPWGDGQAGHPHLITALESILYHGTLAIEREAGNTGKADIQLAIQRLSQL